MLSIQCCYCWRVFFSFALHGNRLNHVEDGRSCDHKVRTARQLHVQSCDSYASSFNGVGGWGVEEGGGRRCGRRGTAKTFAIFIILFPVLYTISVRTWKSISNLFLILKILVPGTGLVPGTIPVIPVPVQYLVNC